MYMLYHPWLRRLLLLTLLLSACRAPAAPDLPTLNQEILRLTNQLRREQGLAALESLPVLTRVSQQHSTDMARRDFFEHTNPDGQSPFDRLQVQAPNLLAVTSAENIALHSLDGLDAPAMAAELLRLWRDSPEHYQHLINPQLWHLGVASALQGQKLYATQTFAAAVAELEPDLPRDQRYGETVRLRFRFLAPFARTELRAFLTVPDANARIPDGQGRYLIGKGPLPLNWQDETHFEISFPLKYGLGRYQLKLGRGAAYYDAPFTFIAHAH